MTGELHDVNRTAIGEIIDRQRIWDCLLRYTRGVDRLDRDLALACFHADAMIDQGAFKGDREAFVDWVIGVHRDQQVLTQHIMANHSCEIAGDEAHAETYVTYYGVNPGGTDAFAVGRYVDRLERRDGHWGVTDRVCMTEGATDLVRNQVVARFAPPPGSVARTARDRSDPSYHRPLVVPR